MCRAKSNWKKSNNFNELCPKKITSAIEELDQLNRPICFLGGGETVVNVTGPGKGGRNQVREHSQLSPVSLKVFFWDFYPPASEASRGVY